MSKNQPLTNFRSVIRFTQYGQAKEIVYNGCMIDASNAVYFGYGILPSKQLHIGTREENTYLPCGYSSISTL